MQKELSFKIKSLKYDPPSHHLAHPAGSLHAAEIRAAVTKPLRIVSMNPCVDAILMEIASPNRIAAISHYSHDARATSIDLQRALQFPTVSDAAEDAIAANPDLVITGPHVSLQTVAALERLGISVMQVAVPESVAQSKAQIIDIANRIGQTQNGHALNARIDAALAASHIRDTPVSALIWQGSGLVPGQGTLADELLTHSGFTNISTSLRLQKWDILPLEGLLANPPAVLFSGKGTMGSGDTEANRMLSHPALRRARTRIHVAPFPARLLNCGGPVIIKTAAHLAKVRRSLEAQ
jgi:iron complex transport system substrate-binding protein